MRKIIEKTKKHSLMIAVVAVITFGVVSAILSLNAGIAQAVTSQPVSPFSVMLVSNAKLGWEHFTISYDGGVGVMDISGWKVYSGTDIDPIYTFEAGTEVTPTVAIRVCEDKTLQTSSCDFQWVEGFKFDDSTGNLIIKDSAGSLVHQIEYSDISEYDSAHGFYSSNDWVYEADVYGKSDKIELCHVNGKGVSSMKPVPTSSFINNYEAGRKGHHIDEGDIVPPFFYNLKGEVKYFGGKDWDAAGEASYELGCQ